MRAHEFITESRKKIQKTWIETYSPADIVLSKKWGGGILKENVIREQPSGKILKFSLQYINSSIQGGDKEGRILGYDNSHGYAHRHYFDTIEPINFSNYEELYDKFQQEWMEIAMKFKKGML